MIALLLATEAMSPPATACAAPVTVPGLERWSAAPAPALAVGARAALALAPAGSVDFAPPLARPAVPGSYGGAFPFDVVRPGDYRIALSAGAWIDLVRDGARLASTAHEHGPACSGIAKIVTFRLEPGRYQLQLSEAKAPAIKVLIAPAG